jgi:hypothetical protein
MEEYRRGEDNIEMHFKEICIDVMNWMELSLGYSYTSINLEKKRSFCKHFTSLDILLEAHLLLTGLPRT